MSRPEIQFTPDDTAMCPQRCRRLAGQSPAASRHVADIGDISRGFSRFRFAGFMKNCSAQE